MVPFGTRDGTCTMHNESKANLQEHEFWLTNSNARENLVITAIGFAAAICRRFIDVITRT